MHLNLKVRYHEKHVCREKQNNGRRTKKVFLCVYSSQIKDFVRPIPKYWHSDTDY